MVGQEVAHPRAGMTGGQDAICREQSRGCISTVCHQLVPQPDILSGVDLHLPQEQVRRLVEKSTHTHVVLLQLTLVPQSKSFLVFWYFSGLWTVEDGRGTSCYCPSSHPGLL